METYKKYKMNFLKSNMKFHILENNLLKKNKANNNLKQILLK